MQVAAGVYGYTDEAVTSARRGSLGSPKGGSGEGYDSQETLDYTVSRSRALEDRDYI